MFTPSSPPKTSTETAFETQLRATLQDAAPANVDLEQGWSAVTERLPMLNGQETGAINRAPTFSLNDQRRSPMNWVPTPSRKDEKPARWWKRTPAVVAAIVLALVLMGASVVGVSDIFHLWDGPIQDQHLYQNIGQTQQQQQVTITVTQAYTDESGTLIKYDLSVSDSLAKRYNLVAVGEWSLTSQYGEEPSGASEECTSGQTRDSPIHCLINETAFHLPAGVTQLTITFDVLKIYLSQADEHTDMRNTLTGDWHFQFTLTFHSKHLAPNGPFPQATPTSTR